MTAHYDNIIEKRDFDSSAPTSAWGVHDPAVLGKLIADIDTATVPVFAAVLTLSSHEPYTVPGLRVVPGRDEEARFLNAQAYTDRAVSTFLTRMRESPRWDSSLIVILGDHGSMFPLDTTSSWGVANEFNIPMVWLGGAVGTGGTVIDAIGSQCDMPALLLDQLAIDRSGFPWSRDFLIPGSAQFAFYAFPNTFGFVDPRGSYLFDNLAKKVVFRSGAPASASLAAGRAFQQRVTESYGAMTKPGSVDSRRISLTRSIRGNYR